MAEIENPGAEAGARVGVNAGERDGPELTAPSTSKARRSFAPQRRRHAEHPKAARPRARQRDGAVA